MRTLVIAAAIVIGMLYARPSSACEDCYDYFDWQALDWCLFCDYADCGGFHCNVVDWSPGVEACRLDDNGCFEIRRFCPKEPQVRLEPATRLGETWRLVGMRSYAPGQGRDRRERGALTVANKG